MQPHSFSKRRLAAIALMLDEEEKNVALSDKKKRIWVNKCFRNRKSEGSYGRNSDGGIFAHSELWKYLETHLSISKDKQLPGTLCLAPYVIILAPVRTRSITSKILVQQRRRNGTET